MLRMLRGGRKVVIAFWVQKIVIQPIRGSDVIIAKQKPNYCLVSYLVTKMTIAIIRK